jgi:hypothetical protein
MMGSQGEGSSSGSDGGDDDRRAIAHELSLSGVQRQGSMQVRASSQAAVSLRTKQTAHRILHVSFFRHVMVVSMIAFVQNWSAPASLQCCCAL